MRKSKQSQQSGFEKFASAITRKTGSTGAFIIALTIVIIWLVTGPLFNYSDTWQLVINTGTTIVTFLMVFLIQKTQNKDSIAIQLKLNELVACNDKASNRLINVEDFSEDELRTLQKYFHKLAEMTKKESDIHISHSLDEATDRHEEKMKTLKHKKK
ncbi:MAG: low affinity iron permease family protein [Bacteroidota bacterium]